MNQPISAEWTAQELISRIEAGEDIQVLDVRAPRRLENGRIELVAESHFFNHKGSELMAAPDIRTFGLSDEAPVAVVCGLGNDSQRIAALMEAQGFAAYSVTGGMTEWARTIIVRELAAPEPLDRLFQFDRVGKGALAYALVSGGEALLIDPPRQVEVIQRTMRSVGARIVGVADTHAHADYISGSPLLASQLGVPYYLHPGDAVLPFDGRAALVETRPILEGACITIGRAEIEVLHMPGHTEGSVCFRLGDAAVFTGDFVFVRSVGRPDLGGKQAEWTAALWRSLSRARASWAPTVDVFPAHYANESERNADFTVGCEFGVVCRNNEPLAIEDEAEFGQWVRQRTGGMPDAYRRIKAINLGLETVDDVEADELEAGKNQCALG